MERTPASSDRINGLDSIRFICAVWVLFGHFALPPLAQVIGPTTHLGYLVGGIMNRTFTGTPAVIIFFIISGFCIHYPYSKPGNPLHLGEFYARRFVRILIPALVAIPISRSVEVNLSLFQESILWSLVAELIYYCLYPLLRAIACAWSWKLLVALSFVGAFAVALTNPTAPRYPAFGLSLTWALGLPCWLLGCVLAESVRSGNKPAVTSLNIWSWRLGLYLAAMVCVTLRFHAHIGFPWTLNLFALVGAMWLSREIAYYRTHPAVPFLEWAGLWSYSLYLMHMPSKPFFDALQLPNLGYLLNWAILCGFVFAFCYVFYLLVEKPGHGIARRAAKLFKNLRRADPIKNVPAAEASPR
jgi:peptidoglycan/LPS O-acetylase OafA/YrhL